MEKREGSNSRVRYILGAAEESRYNARHWLRYLRKMVTDENAKLTKEEIAEIISQGQLTMYQKISLIRAMEPDTPTNKYVISLNQHAKTPLLDQIMRKYRINE